MKDNFSIIIETEKKFSDIVEKTLKDKYGHYNIENEKIMSLEYPEESYADAHSDLENITNILKEIYIANDFDCFCSVFASACNCCYMYALVNVINYNEIIEAFSNVSNNDGEKNFLKRFGEAIFNQGKNEDNMSQFLMEARRNNIYLTVLWIYEYVLETRMYFLATQQQNDDKKKDALHRMYDAREKLNNVDERYFKYIAPYEDTEEEKHFQYLPYIQYKNETEHFLQSYVSYKEAYENELLKELDKLNLNDEQHEFLKTKDEINMLTPLIIANSNNMDLKFYKYMTSNMLTKLEESLNSKAVILFISHPIDNTSSYLDRTTALNLPLIVWNKTGLNELHHLVQLEVDNAELNKKEKEKQEIITAFSHRYKNMRATSLKELAEQLLSKSKLSDEDLLLKRNSLGRRALLEFGIKENLTKEVEMVQLQFENKSEELQQKILNSMTTETDEEKETIDDILRNALKRDTITLLYDGQKEAKEIRKAFKNFDLISIRDEFDSIIFEQQSDLFDWFCNAVFEIKTTISNEWKKLYFQKNSYASLMITDIIAELLINIFKYADKSKNIKFEFKTNENNFIIESINYVSNINIDLNSKLGLSSINDTLEILNNASCENTLSGRIENDVYKTTVSINKSLLEP